MNVGCRLFIEKMTPKACKVMLTVETTVNITLQALCAFLAADTETATIVSHLTFGRNEQPPVFFLPHQNLAKSHHLSSGAKYSKHLNT